MRYWTRNVGAQNIYYDGVKLAEYFDVMDLTISPLPDMEIGSIAIPGKPGTHYNELAIGERTLTLTLSLKAWDANPIHIYQFWREYSPLLLKDEPKPMQLDEHKSINVIVQSAGDIERLGRRGTSEITFVANDPFFYGENHTVKLSTGTNTFSVLGGYEVWPTLEITGVSGDLLVTNETTADRVHIPEVAAETVKVGIDMERARCTSNGEYLPVDMTTTDYFSLPVGLAKIKLSNGAGTLTYKERYL